MDFTLTKTWYCESSNFKRSYHFYNLCFILYQSTSEGMHDIVTIHDSGTGIDNQISGTGTDNLQTLKAMFPTTAEATLKESLLSADNNLNMAVAIIVGDNDDFLLHSVLPISECNYNYHKCQFVTLLHRFSGFRWFWTRSQEQRIE